MVRANMPWSPTAAQPPMNWAVWYYSEYRIFGSGPDGLDFARTGKQEAYTMPLGHVGKPEDVANVILFFASNQAGWVTGQLLYVDGGHVMPL